jgi:ferric-dicitrate binding protein FerR (iron transport regulator)
MGGTADEPERDPNRDDDLGRLIRMAAPRAQAPADRAARVKAATKAAWRLSVARSRRRAWIVRMSAAAAALLALGIGWLVLSSMSSPQAAQLASAAGKIEATDSSSGAWKEILPGAGAKAGDSVRTGADSRAAFILAGGGTMKLDAGTLIRFQGSGEVRLESGAVYLDIAKGEGGMAIRTRLGSVRNVATRFEVRLAGEVLRVAVREGRVSISGSEGEAEASAGEVVRVLQGSKIEREKAPDEETPWVLQCLVPFDLDGRTLGEFLRWASRQGGWDLAHLPAGADGIVVYGSVRGMTVEEALDAVLPACGMKRSIVGRALVVSRKE